MRCIVGLRMMRSRRTAAGTTGATRLLTAAMIRRRHRMTLRTATVSGATAAAIVMVKDIAARHKRQKGQRRKISKDSHNESSFVLFSTPLREAGIIIGHSPHPSQCQKQKRPPQITCGGTF